MGKKDGKGTLREYISIHGKLILMQGHSLLLKYTRKQNPLLYCLLKDYVPKTSIAEKMEPDFSEVYDERTRDNLI